MNILLLSVPTVPAALWARKLLAPTRLRLTGAGLLASSLAMPGYGLRCPERSPAFWSIGYAVGMLVPARIGEWAGRMRYGDRAAHRSHRRNSRGFGPPAHPCAGRDRARLALPPNLSGASPGRPDRILAPPCRISLNRSCVAV